MSADSYTEVTNQSWLGRIGGAFKGIIIGLIIVAVSLFLLFWNEGRAVKRYKTLQEGSAAMLSVNSSEIDPANEGKLVHLSGLTKTYETLVDHEFAVSAQAIKLRRTVEMYQWQESSHSEEKKNLGGGTETTTTYSYDRTWSESLINSGSFKRQEGHQNPAVMRYRSSELVAGNVQIGAFTLSRSLTDMMGNYTPLTIARETALPSVPDMQVSRQAGGFYIGSSPDTPRVGDLRITFTEVLPSEISIITSQQGNSFEPYQTRAGGTIELLQPGIVTADDMMARAQQDNRILTWIVRAVGFFLMFIGIRTILAPLAVFADVVPLLGNIVGAGSGLIAALLAAFLSSVTIGIAWLVYRPLIGGIILAAATGIIVLLIIRMKRQPPVPAVSTTPPPPPPGS